MMKLYPVRATLSTVIFASLILFLAIPLTSIAQTKQETLQKLTHWLTPEEMTRLDEIGMYFVETDPPASPIRNVAEFDHMQGVLIRYPFGIPFALIKEMADDIMVTAIVSSTGQQNSVLNQYISNGVDTSNCNFLIAGTNSHWTRDYGPWFESDSANQIGIVDFPYNRPRPLDDEIPKEVANMLGIPWFGMRLEHTGGNYMTDGYGIAASTTIVWTENPMLTHEQVAEKVHDYLGINTYHVRPDPNGTYIDHIDCWAKFLAPDKILVREVPTYHPRYNQIEAAAAYWAAETCAYGYNYQVFRVNTPGNQPYTNSLILNKKVLVPIMNSTWDDSALVRYEEAMPGYEVIGFIGKSSAPWESTDALHCRAKGIADVGLLYIRHYPLFGNHPCEEDYTIDAELIVCSDTTVINDSILIHYRVNNGPWIIVNMGNTSESLFSGIIPKQPGENVIEYYLTAADHSGRHANAPYIGEPDPFQFNTIYTNITAIPDTLKFNTPEECLEGKVTVLNNFTNTIVTVTDIQEEGFNPAFSWHIETVPVTPYSLNPNDTTELRVRVDLPLLDQFTGYALDTLEVTSSVGTVRVIIAVNDSLLTGNQELLAGISGRLGQNYPNPVMKSTIIPFTIIQPDHVTIDVFDVRGKRVASLADAFMQAGNHAITWNGVDQSGRKVPGGIYIYTMRTTNKIQSRRMVLIQ